MQQVRLRETLSPQVGIGGRRGKLHEPLQRRLSSGQPVVLVLQSGRHQPGLRQIRLFLRDGFQLATGLWVALQAQQYPCVRHAQVRDGLLGQGLRHDGLRVQQAFVHQLQRQPGGTFAGIVQALRPACRVQRAGLVARSEPQAAQRYPGLGSGGWIGEFVDQRLFHHFGGQRFVTRTSIQLRQGGQRRSLGPWGGLCEFLAQQFRCLGDAVQRDQDLQHILIGLARLGQGFLPGSGGSQGVFARS